MQCALLVGERGEDCSAYSMLVPRDAGEREAFHPVPNNDVVLRLQATRHQHLNGDKRVARSEKRRRNEAKRRGERLVLVRTEGRN